MTAKMRAHDIVGLLAEKHAGDVFVPECKNGSTWLGTELCRLDAWAMKRSWSPLTTIGYEVKVSRSDFERDQKWADYLPLCHAFSFVCPAGLIKGHDLPDGVGLIWVSKSGRLHTKRKAKRREPDAEKLSNLLSYVLMSRTVIVSGMVEANRGEAEETGELARLREIREAVEAAEAREDLAHVVNVHVRSRYNDMRAKVEAATEAAERADEIVAHLKTRGIEWDPHDRWGTWDVRKQIDELLGHVDLSGLTGAMARAEKQLAAAREEIEKVTG